ncbi:hypothetical protein HON22_03525 [Candidatus Peregrinibacteria bacterium]|jgi:hypothetical protein|nr:hypothetical protein [Candidatus Peregrinibacteria bacterium]
MKTKTFKSFLATLMAFFLILSLSPVYADDHVDSTELSDTEFDIADENKDGVIDEFEECIHIKGFPETFCESALKIRDDNVSETDPEPVHTDIEHFSDEDDFDKENQFCPEIYQPVCAERKVQCFTTPCEPIKETFSNSCFADIEDAHVLYEGQCDDDTHGSNNNFSSEGNMFDDIWHSIEDTIREVEEGYLHWFDDNKFDKYLGWIESEEKNGNLSEEETDKLIEYLKEIDEKFETGELIIGEPGDSRHEDDRDHFFEDEFEDDFFEDEFEDDFKKPSRREMLERMKRMRKETGHDEDMTKHMRDGFEDDAFEGDDFHEDRFEDDFFEDFDPDLNFDGIVDEFEGKIADCMKEIGGMHMGICQRKAKESMHDEWNKWEPDDFMSHTEDEGFFDEFDPDVFHDFEEDDFEDFDPKFFNKFIDEAPENFRRFNPHMFEFMAPERMDEFDPRMFEHMNHFGREIDPGIFGNIEDEEFFDEFDPDFFNHVDFDEIPEDVFGKIDPTKFDEIDPELLDKFERFAPERFEMIPQHVRRASELMSDDISEDLLAEFGFSGAEAEKVRGLMKVVNKQKRDEVMNILDDIDEEVRRGFMDFEEGFENEVGTFMEYMPHVPKRFQEEFLGHKKDFLEHAEKLDKEFDELSALIDDETEALLESFENEISSYNFTGEAAAELKKYISEFLAEIDSLNPEEVEDEIHALLDIMGGLKDKARDEKFSQGIIPFKDTDDNQWFTTFVSEAADGGVIGGYKDANGNSLGEFRPANNVTVAEALKMALANAKLKETSGTPANSGAADHWVKGWVKTAEDKGVSLSTSTDLNRNATRGEVVRWIIESFGIAAPKANTSSFSDVRTSDKNIDYIEYAKTMGLISGDGATGKFRPRDGIIRAEVAKILQKATEVFATSTTSSTSK